LPQWRDRSCDLLRRVRATFPTASAAARRVPQDLCTAKHEKAPRKFVRIGRKLSLTLACLRYSNGEQRGTPRIHAALHRVPVRERNSDGWLDHGTQLVRAQRDDGSTRDRGSREGDARLLRIDHAAGASTAGLDLRPTEVLIFGNPQAGTKLMQQTQTIGLELPLKVIVWQDASGKTWLGYDEPRWLAMRFGIAEQMTAVTDAMTSGLAAFATHATGS